MAIIPGADTRRHMRKLYPSWVMVTKKGSVILRACRECISTKIMVIKIQKDPVVGLQNNMTEILCKFVKEQSAPEVDSQPFDGNPYIYFLSMFRKSVKKEIEDPKSRLTRLILYIRGGAKDLIKNFINNRPEYG